MPFKKKNQFEISVLSFILIVCILLFSVKTHSLQIKNASLITGIDADGAAAVRTAVLKAPRGEILDCYGRQIAINRDGYNIVFNKAYIKDNLNNVILALVNTCISYETAWIDELPLSLQSPYNFTDDEKAIKKLTKKLDLAHYASNKDCFKEMVDRYDLKGYSKEDQRKIMGVRYSMEIADFSLSYPFTFAEDISSELMLKVSENSFLLSGVTIDVVPFREYTDTTFAVNLIGSVGPIYKEDWEEYKKKGYSYSDKVGKSGIEKWAEEYLRGTDGEIAYRLDANGNILSSVVTKQPVAGKTIMLTLDKSIQKSAQDSLKTVIKNLQSQGSSVVAGTAVAIDINTGGVICAANYPTYDSATMNKNYESLKNDPAKPLTNRAFQGVYPIGSTIKPIVSLAAMQNNKYHIGETINCVHTYNFFEDYKPKCMHRHGSIALKTALSKSCNYFFFELGRRVGATTLTDYFMQFGLGVKTGVEVDDAAGILLKPTSDGVGGTTLQISIGQLNAFTPLQLANYTSTLANGGTHYKATLIDKIVSYDISKVYDENKPVVQNNIEINQTYLNAIKEGMLSVTEDGTGRAALGDYPIKVGGKTGTSQVTNAADHSVFIAFAPFDKPEIAISVVLEHGSSGYSAGTVVRNILDAYFFTDNTTVENPPLFTVLS